MEEKNEIIFEDNIKFGLIEDLAPLFPTSPFEVNLDNKYTEKNVVVISEMLDFEHTDHLVKAFQKTRYTSQVAVYITAGPENANFNYIYKLLKDYYDICRGLEGQVVSGKRIETVSKTGLFGYVGKDKTGNYGFILNMNVDYYIQ